MATSHQLAPAKINLCLHVTAQRTDGYHLLDSIVAFAEFGDRLCFTPASNVSLTIDGPFSQGLAGAGDNLILRAARCFAPGNGCAIHLQKNLPVASGIGGGSADAAAALRGLAEIWEVAVPDVASQITLGADVPVCLHGETVRMRGIGEEMSALPYLPELPVVLINPGIGVPTPAIFSHLTEKNNPPIRAIPNAPLSLTQAVEWLRQQRNDLQVPAIATAPVIADVLDVLQQSGANLARMSGSGATCFGIYETPSAAETAADQLSRTHPDWWVQATRLNGSNDAGHHEI